MLLCALKGFFRITVIAIVLPTTPKTATNVYKVAKTMSGAVMVPLSVDRSSFVLLPFISLVVFFLVSDRPPNFQ